MEANTAEDYLVVIPSIRPVNHEYLEALREFDIVICDDSDGKVDRSSIVHKAYKDYGYKQISCLDGRRLDEQVPQEYRYLFARHCPSIKSLGLWYAWNKGYKAVILIDDDVDTRMRQAEDFMTIGKPTPVYRWETASGWFNTLAQLKGVETDLYARGYPYAFRGEPLVVGKALEVYPHFNEGLWTGTPDINGIDKLEMSPNYVITYGSGEGTRPWYIPKETGDYMQGELNALIGVDQHLPLSIMNCQLDAALIPAFYQPPDYLMYRSFKIRRHDDIWSMYFLKRVMDYMDLTCTAGNPICWHRKAGDPIQETLSEHYTNLIQPVLTHVLDRAYEIMCDLRYIGTAYVPESLPQVAFQLAGHGLAYLDKYHDSRWNVVIGDYLTRCRDWARMFQ